MQSKHVPSVGTRYWSALCIASVFGANMGDFCARYLGLGHVKGLPILGVMLVIIFMVESRDRYAASDLLLAGDHRDQDRGN